MTRTRQEVMAAVLGLFPSRSAKGALEILDLYGVESHEPERERVQLAILALSKGNEDKLLHLVEAAKQDYRDVLYWAEYPQESGPDGLLLEVLRRSWVWALTDPVHILMQSAFGNILVACHDGTLWRVIPEELAAKKIRDDKNFIAAFEDEEFRTDWFLEGVADAALAALGPLREGQCYAFKTWPIMGGSFTPDNLYIATTMDWLSLSGNVGKQIKDFPNGARITLDLIDERSIRVVTVEQTNPATQAYDSVEAGVRNVMTLLAEQRYDELEQFTRGTQLSATDIALVIQDYGKTVVPCPEPIEDLLDIVAVREASRPTWSVIVPVYTREEGRSDLSIELTVVELGKLGGGAVAITLDSIRVR